MSAIHWHSQVSQLAHCSVQRVLVRAWALVGVLIPAVLLLGLGGLVSFMWTVKSGQPDDCGDSVVGILIENADRSESESGS